MVSTQKHSERLDKYLLLVTANKLFSVKDYVCVITGGGTGIGLMSAQALAANGAKVYITGRRAEALENAAKSHDPSGGGQIIPIPNVDVTSKEDLERCYQEIKKREKHINLANDHENRCHSRLLYDRRLLASVASRHYRQWPLPAFQPFCHRHLEHVRHHETRTGPLCLQRRQGWYRASDQAHEW